MSYNRRKRRGAQLDEPTLYTDAAVAMQEAEAELRQRMVWARAVMSRVCPIVKIVRHEHIEDHLRLGWMMLAGLGPVHGQWAILMGWKCQCRMVVPL